MRAGLHDAEMEHFGRKNKFPNYALMKISAWHKAQGDSVEWWEPLCTYDRVYSSKFPDYSIYPDCDYAIGFITRGCSNKCRWCVVPRKEGNIRPYRAWKDLVRPDTDKLVLMDNNILACDYGVEQLAGLIGSGYRIDLNQGMDARLITPEIVDILARVKWINYIRFSCDQESQIEPVLHTCELLKERGIKLYRVFIYLLVTADLDSASRRVETLKRLRGINLYAQAERNESLGIRPNRAQLEFAQRYVYSGCFRRESWDEYLERKRKWEVEGGLTDGLQRKG